MAQGLVEVRSNYAFKPTAEHVLSPSCRAWRDGGLTRTLDLTAMTLNAKERSAARRHVRAAVEPQILALGFARRSAGVFTRFGGGDRELRLVMESPRTSLYFRIFVAVGPGIPALSTTPYGCPDSPNGKKYNFYFHRAPETAERCVTNLLAWLHEVLRPWLMKHGVA